jgi:hypothetical protein
MRCTLEKNGNLRLRLEPTDALERAFLDQMASDSEKGATTILAAPGAQGTEFVLEIGGKQ